MRKLLTGAALSAMLIAGNASSNTTEWVGRTSGVEPGCFFISNDNGDMALERSESGFLGVWYTTKAAKLVVMVRRSGDAFATEIESITIEPVTSDLRPGGSVWSYDQSGGIDEWEAVINYKTSLAAGTQVLELPDGWVISYDKTLQLNEKITITTDGSQNIGSGYIRLQLGGTAVVDYRETNRLFDANREYKISHMTSCIQ